MTEVRTGNGSLKGLLEAEEGYPHPLFRTFASVLCCSQVLGALINCVGGNEINCIAYASN
jgi:hypothetical protein